MTPEVRSAIVAVESAAVAIDAARAALVESARVLRASLEVAEPPAPVPAPEPPPADPPVEPPAPEPPAPPAEPPVEPPAPEPPAPPAEPPAPVPARFEPPVEGESQVRQYLLDDSGGGPNYQYWAKHLGIEWENWGLGDWTDAFGVEQGAAAFASANPGVGPTTMNVTALVTKLIENGNQGIRLTAIRGSFTLSGRASEAPPRLVVTTSNGPVECPCIASPQWAPKAKTALTQDSRQSVLVDAYGWTAGFQFDLRAVGDVLDAQLTINVQTRFGSSPLLQLFALRLSRFTMGADSGPVITGLAARVGEAALPLHPSVIAAGDFSGSTVTPYGAMTRVFGRVNNYSGVPAEFLPNPDAPGTTMWRGTFVPVTTATDQRREAFNGTIQLQRPDLTDPMRPAVRPLEEAYYRMYFFLEEDFGTAADGNKMAITWDLRLGWWNNVGYWQQVSGNGGQRGDGRKGIRTLPDGSKRYEYRGHMLRMECGMATENPGPYSDIRPLIGYNYHIDQGGPFPGGDTDSLGGAVYGNVLPAKIQKGRWYCVEQRLKMNSIDLSNPDALGNGEARADGILTTWLNGRLIDRRDNYRWRRHPDMGIGGVNSNWYLGGRQPTSLPMHWRISDIAVATEYIGPRVA